MNEHLDGEGAPFHEAETAGPEQAVVEPTTYTPIERDGPWRKMHMFCLPSTYPSIYNYRSLPIYLSIY